MKIGVGDSGFFNQDIISYSDGKPAGNPCGMQMGISADGDDCVKAVGILGHILGAIPPNAGDGAIRSYDHLSLAFDVELAKELQLSPVTIFLA